MASWHQQRNKQLAKTPLWHATKWTVVEDKTMLCLTTFDSRAAAYKYAEGVGGYVLPPREGGRTT